MEYLSRVLPAMTFLEMYTYLRNSELIALPFT